MKLLAFLLATLSAAAAQTIPASIEWAACGPSFNGHQWGASCGFAVPLSASQGLGSWTAMDFTFANGKPANSLSTGFALDARHYKMGAWTLHLNLLTTAGVTTTPTATTASFTGGFHAVSTYKHLAIGAGFRGATGAAATRLYNLSLGYFF